MLQHAYYTQAAVSYDEWNGEHILSQVMGMMMTSQLLHSIWILTASDDCNCKLHSIWIITASDCDCNCKLHSIWILTATDCDCNCKLHSIWIITASDCNCTRRAHPLAGGEHMPWSSCHGMAMACDGHEGHPLLQLKADNRCGGCRARRTSTRLGCRCVARMLLDIAMPRS